MTLQQKLGFDCIVRFHLSFKMIRVFGLERHRLNAVVGWRLLQLVCARVRMCACGNPHLSRSSNLKWGPRVFHRLWCSDACIMALNCEFSSASRAAGLSNSKIWKWKMQHRSLPAHKSAPAYSFCEPVYRQHKIETRFGYKYRKLT